MGSRLCVVVVGCVEREDSSPCNLTDYHPSVRTGGLLCGNLLLCGRACAWRGVAWHGVAVYTVYGVYTVLGWVCCDS